MTRRVLVTGGSKGIGLALARACASQGDRVTVLSRQAPKAAGGLHHLACDLRSPSAVREALTDWGDSALDGDDVFLHCAGAYGSAGRHPFLESTVEEWDEAMGVNARGLLLALRCVLPTMLARRRGLVVCISSDVALQPGPGRIPYAASKAAAHAVMIGLAAELLDTGVVALEVRPTGQVDTPGIRSRRPADFDPLGYAPASSFVAPTLWLMDGNAARFHGACLLVDPEGRLLDVGGEVIA